VPEQCRTEATTEQTMEMGHRSASSRSPAASGKVVIGSETGMYVGVLERLNEAVIAGISTRASPGDSAAARLPQRCPASVVATRCGTDRLALGDVAVTAH